MEIEEDMIFMHVDNPQGIYLLWYEHINIIIPTLFF